MVCVPNLEQLWKQLQRFVRYQGGRVESISNITLRIDLLFLVSPADKDVSEADIRNVDFPDLTQYRLEKMATDHLDTPEYEY